MSTETNHAEDQARLQMQSIAQMVAALSVDWDRLSELRDERDAHKADESNMGDFEDTEEGVELAELEAAIGEATDEDSAREILDQDALSVEVRSGWQSQGETLEPAEFCILLCTGGPAVRIVGDLDDDGTPSRPRLEYQDWGRPWTEFFDVDRAALLAYCEAYLGGY